MRGSLLQCSYVAFGSCAEAGAGPDPGRFSPQTGLVTGYHGAASVRTLGHTANNKSFRQAPIVVVSYGFTR